MKRYANYNLDELVWTLDYWKDYLRIHELKKIELFEMKRDLNIEYMWCREWQSHVERKSGECGAHCKQYNPRNGKSGMCKRLSHTYIETGKKFILESKNFKLKRVAENVV